MKKSTLLNPLHLARSSASPPIEYLLLWILSGCLRLGGVALSLKCAAVAIAVAVISSPALLLGYLMLASLYPRRLTSVSDTSVSVLGKPLLFPVTLTHNRLAPVLNRFTHSVLMVGVPVGIKCQIGKILAIDADETLPSWFTFDSKRYLHRGDEHLGLREKLDVFLRDQKEDPSQWPYAYLLSVPRFLWWERSVVTWWFLYSESREFDAVIMEINNSFDEKRNVFFKVHATEAEAKALESSLDTDTKMQSLDMKHTIASMTSQSSAIYYKGKWEKDIYSSPFEKLGDTVIERFMDPTNPAAWNKMRSMSNTTTLAASGHPKMMTRLSCRRGPVDPTTASYWTIAKLLVSWTLPVLLTTPRILYQALRIEYLGLMRMMYKPDIRTGSEARRATGSECGLEPFFRQYLAHCVASCPFPLEVNYSPSKSISREEVPMYSPACFSDEDKATAKSLVIEVLDPGFYSRIRQYEDPILGLKAEATPPGYEADKKASPLKVSDLSLLKALIQSSPSYQSRTTRNPERQAWFGDSSFMDDFAKRYLSSLSQRDYRSLKLRLLAEKVSFGDPAFLQLYKYAGAIAWRVGVTELLGRCMGGSLEAVYLGVLHAGVACLA